MTLTEVGRLTLNIGAPSHGQRLDCMKRSIHPSASWLDVMCQLPHMPAMMDCTLEL